MSLWARHYSDALFDISTFTIFLDNNYTLADLNFFSSFLSHLFVFKNTAKFGFKKWKFSSVSQSCLTLQPQWLQHARPPCPSPTPGAYSNSCSLSRWCHPTIPSSVIPFSFHLPSFPASGSFQMNQFFASGGQSIGVSASASVLPMNIQDWFPLGLTSLISLQSKGLSRVFSQFKSIHSSALSFLYSSTL